MISVRHESTYRSNLQDNTNNDVECTLDQLFRQFFKKQIINDLFRTIDIGILCQIKILYLFLKPKVNKRIILFVLLTNIIIVILKLIN